MFLKVSDQVGFTKSEMEEINNSFQSIEDKINKYEIPSETVLLSTYKVNISSDYIEQNYSVKVGKHQMNILLALNKITDIETHEGSGESLSKYFEDLGDGVYKPKDYDLWYVEDKESYVSQITHEGIVWYIYLYSGLVTSASLKMTKMNMKVGKVKYPPITDLKIRLATKSNDLTKCYYGVIHTDGDIEVIGNPQEETFLQTVYLIGG